VVLASVATCSARVYAVGPISWRPLLLLRSMSHCYVAARLRHARCGIARHPRDASLQLGGVARGTECLALAWELLEPWHSLMRRTAMN